MLISPRGPSSRKEVGQNAVQGGQEEHGHEEESGGGGQGSISSCGRYDNKCDNKAG